MALFVLPPAMVTVLEALSRFALRELRQCCCIRSNIYKSFLIGPCLTSWLESNLHYAWIMRTLSRKKLDPDM
jgi:hypothetical protein